ncbi:hypothetical protein BH23BAC4_BH23BAC4_03870 [soil metagenome]
MRGRVALVSGALGATITGLYIYQRNAWWAEENRGRFHFHDDRGYTKHLDKVGHFNATYFQSMAVAQSLRWSGLSPSRTAAYGALAAWLVQLQVEINDGFNDLWGFDVYDVVANTLGATYFYAREQLPALDPFMLKLSYWPSEYLLHGIEKPGGTHSPGVIDDYLGHTYWLSVRLHDLLPESARPLWPGWLMLAGGVSGDRLYTPEQQRSYYVALDLYLERIIPAKTWLAASRPRGPELPEAAYAGDTAGPAADPLPPLLRSAVNASTSLRSATSPGGGGKRRPIPGR